jgi:Sulfotransferase family
MLDAHPAIAVPYESHLYNRFYPLMARRSAELGPGPVRERLVREILRTRALQHWRPQPSAEAILAAVRRPGFHGVVEALFETWTASRGKRRWGEKTPRHTLWWGTILEGFPHVKILHLVRDGRDVALSFRDAPFGPKHVYQAAKHWMQYIQASEAAAVALGPAACLTVRYEDLLRDAEGQLRRICGFLGEDYDPVMLSYHRSDVPYPSDPRNLAALRQPVRNDNHTKWRGRLSRREQRIFEAIAGDVLERYGYPRAVDGPRMTDWEALSCRYLEHPPRRLLAMLRNREGYTYALENFRLALRLRYGV